MSFGFWRLPLKELTDRRLGHIRNLPGANHRGRASWSMVQCKGPGNLAKLSVTQDVDGSEQHFPWCPSPKKVSKVLLGCCWLSKIISPGAPEMSHPKNNSNFKYQVKFKKKTLLSLFRKSCHSFPFKSPFHWVSTAALMFLVSLGISWDLRVGGSKCVSSWNPSITASEGNLKYSHT